MPRSTLISPTCVAAVVAVALLALPGVGAPNLDSTGTTPLGLSPNGTAGATTSANRSPSDLSYWKDLTRSLGHAPPARENFGLVYDRADAYTLLYGGVNVSGTAFGDTWIIRNGTWTQLHPPTSPGPRVGVQMTYDAATRSVLLFGGYLEPPSFAGRLVNDTWTFHAGLWTNITANVTMSPPPRYLGGLSYDAADGYDLMFGGVGSSSILNTTWTFANLTWTHLKLRAHPGATYPVTMDYDASAGRVVLFGDWSGETWLFGGGKWTQFSRASPPASSDGQMAFDLECNCSLLFSGVTGYPYSQLADLWAFHNRTWTHLTFADPPGREDGAMIFDGARHHLILFGGISWTPSGSSQNDTWLLR